MLVRLLAEEDVDRPVVADLIYDSADPYAVCMTFQLCQEASVQWVIGRDLLLDGQRELTGLGDVQVWPSQDRGVHRVCIALRPFPEGEPAVLAVSARALEGFLRRTLDVVPLGTEGRHLDLDSIADHLLD
ncbi:SsgA family sporulation/cell division regulator [Streptomyces sp. NPDC001795]|uniref:SsgA family sporulation/cell division regulator n=1 Tax=unclassified Streptomyces TaxID=2593676 RepID=UPI00331ACBC0